MRKLKKYIVVGLAGICLASAGCKVPALVERSNNTLLPGMFEYR